MSQKNESDVKFARLIERKIQSKAEKSCSGKIF